MANNWKHAASDYESEGRRFESCRAQQKTAGLQDKRRPAILFFVACLLSYHGSYHNGISKTH